MPNEKILINSPIAGLGPETAFVHLDTITNEDAARNSLPTPSWHISLYSVCDL